MDDDTPLEILRYIIGFANLEDGWRVGLFMPDENGNKTKLFTVPIRGDMTEERKGEISKALTAFIGACEQPDLIQMKTFDQDTTRN